MTKVHFWDFLASKLWTYERYFYGQFAVAAAGLAVASLAGHTHPGSLWESLPPGVRATVWGVLAVCCAVGVWRPGALGLRLWALPAVAGLHVVAGVSACGPMLTALLAAHNPPTETFATALGMCGLHLALAWSAVACHQLAVIGLSTTPHPPFDNIHPPEKYGG